MSARAIRLTLTLCGALTLGVGTLRAQCSADTKEQFTVTVTPSPINFSQPTAAHFNAGSPGYIDGPTVTLSVSPGRRDSGWKVCLRYPATATSLGNGKALSDLLWSTNGSTWTPVSSTNQIVHSGTTNGTFHLPLYLRALLRWPTDTPFTYGSSLVFTGSY